MFSQKKMEEPSYTIEVMFAAKKIINHLEDPKNEDFAKNLNEKKKVKGEDVKYILEKTKIWLSNDRFAEVSVKAPDHLMAAVALAFEKLGIKGGSVEQPKEESRPQARM